jgi:hypothetical protein
MLPNKLEQAVIEMLLNDHALSPAKAPLRWDAVAVKSRTMTGAGFLTEFEHSPELRVFGEGVSLRWAKAGARLNDARIETGYLVYVDDGYITGVEGYTYGDEWPATIDRIEMYEATEGVELKNPPKTDLV